MGDDPALPQAMIHTQVSPAAGGSGATGGSNVTIYNFGHAGMVILVVAVGLALGIAVGGLALQAYSSRISDEKAERALTEARLMQYYLQDPNSRTPEELSAWAKFVHEHGKEH